MKNRAVRYIAVLSAMAILLFTFLVPSSALYNDAAFDNYTNLSQNSAIPNLFRNNAVFPSYKNYPPVISEGIEYVPLEIFYGLSGVKINYSDDSTNFYIQNKKTNKYISFSLLGDYAVVSGGGTIEARVPTFYNVHYVPLRTVCNATGIGCDSYNDGVNNLYVIKVFTTPGLSARELIKIHAPGIYEDKETDVDTPPVVDDPPKPPAPEEFPPRTIYMMFDSKGFENAGKTLDLMTRMGYKALFAVKAEDILNYPDSIRRIITGGHTICLDIPENGGEIYAEGGLENAVKLAQDTLYDIAKTKARLAFIRTTDTELYNSSSIPERLKDLGLECFNPNINSESDVLPTYYMNTTLTSKIKNLYGTKNHANAYIMLHHIDSGRQAVYTVYDLVRNNAGVRLTLFTEVDSQ